MVPNADSGRDAHGISRNGLHVDLAKQRAWRIRGAQRYAAKRRAGNARARMTTRISPANDWPPLVRKMATKRSGGVCEICVNRKATSLHHRRGRRSRDHRIVNALHLCGWCHDAVHCGSRRRAETHGWIVRQTSEPADIPVLLGGVEVTLTDTGTYQEAA